MNYINQEYKFSDFGFAELRFIGTSSMQSKSIYSPWGKMKGGLSYKKKSTNSLPKI